MQKEGSLSRARLSKAEGGGRRAEGRKEEKLFPSSLPPSALRPPPSALVVQRMVRIAERLRLLLVASFCLCDRPLAPARPCSTPLQQARPASCSLSCD